MLYHWENYLHYFSRIVCILSKYTYKSYYIIYVIYVNIVVIRIHYFLKNAPNPRVYIEIVIMIRVYRILEGGLSSAIRWRRRAGWIRWRVFFEKINRIQDMYHNNSNNLETTFMKLSEKIHYFITEFIDVWQQFVESYSFVPVTVKWSKK